MSAVADANEARRLYQLLQPYFLAATPVYLPWAQRVLNPFPLASSGTAWGDMAQPWPVKVLAFYCTVYVLTTNNATNFWSIRLLDSGGGTMATVDTSGIAAATFARLEDTSINQAAGTNTRMEIVATATLNPGAIYIYPAAAMLITG